MAIHKDGLTPEIATASTKPRNDRGRRPRSEPPCHSEERNLTFSETNLDILKSELLYCHSEERSRACPERSRRIRI